VAFSLSPTPLTFVRRAWYGYRDFAQRVGGLAQAVPQHLTNVALMTFVFCTSSLTMFDRIAGGAGGEQSRAFVGP